MRHKTVSLTLLSEADNIDFVQPELNNEVDISELLERQQAFYDISAEGEAIANALDEADEVQAVFNHISPMLEKQDYKTACEAMLTHLNQRLGYKQQITMESFSMVQEGIGEGIKNVIVKIIEHIKKWASAFWEWIKGFFGKKQEQDAEHRKEENKQADKKIEEAFEVVFEKESKEPSKVTKADEEEGITIHPKVTKDVFKEIITSILNQIPKITNYEETTDIVDKVLKSHDITKLKTHSALYSVALTYFNLNIAHFRTLSSLNFNQYADCFKVSDRVIEQIMATTKAIDKATDPIIAKIKQSVNLKDKELSAHVAEIQEDFIEYNKYLLNLHNAIAKNFTEATVFTNMENLDRVQITKLLGQAFDFKHQKDGQNLFPEIHVDSKIPVAVYEFQYPFSDYSNTIENFLKKISDMRKNILNLLKQASENSSDAYNGMTFTILMHVTSTLNLTTQAYSQLSRCLMQISNDLNKMQMTTIEFKEHYAQAIESFQ